MRHREKSIKRKLFPILLAIMLFQSAMVLAMLLFGGVSRKLKDNSIDVLAQNTENRKIYLEMGIVHHWISVTNNTESIIRVLESCLKEKKKTAQDIRKDSELNQELIKSVTDYVIDMQHRSYGNGVFLILDGPLSAQPGDTRKAGVYIRDMDSSSYAPDNSDMILKRGAPSISKTFGIPLDSFWEPGFSLDDRERSAFYYKPFETASGAKASPKDYLDFGYLGMPVAMEELDQEVMTYSIPLILSDGSVIGVLGVDISPENIRNLLDMNNKARDDSLALSLLGRIREGSNIVEPAVPAGPLYERYFGKYENLQYSKADDYPVNAVEDKEGNTWYASVSRIDVYKNNAPFTDEDWVVLTLIPESELLRTYFEIRTMLAWSLLFPLICGIAAVFLAARIITKPISRLIGELRDVKSRENVKLGHVQISEIDELIDAITSMSAQIASTSSKITGILKAANVPIGVFEYVAANGMVFCSSSLYEMLGREITGVTAEQDYVYIDVSELDLLLGSMHLESRKDNMELGYVEGTSGIRWLQMKMVQYQENNVVGVLTDVTQEIEERKKLEKERNYDLLTDLYNRRAFREKVTELLDTGYRQEIAFVMWDLDNLKYVNDTYGHELGDAYIRLFADYLKTLGDGAILSRHSGDEFLAVLYGGDRETLRERICGFMDGMKQKVLKAGKDYAMPLRASAGVAWYPEHGSDFSALCIYADFAMYMAKHSVKGIVQEFDPEVYRNNSYLLSGGEELNRMIENQNVRFAMQPIVTREGDIYGYELLMRPDNEILKNIGEVMRLARSQAKLHQMEELTWFAAMKWAVRQEKAGNLRKGARFFINSIANVSLSREQLKELEELYPEYLDRIVIEVTEGEPITRDFMDLKIETAGRWGCQIAIDDFGSGYNSETLLLDLKADIVKLDMNLVRNIHQDKSRQTIVGNLINYAQKQGISVLAEGVESSEELSVLMDAGVELFQGYYIGRPELEVRPLNPYIIQKLKDLSKK